MDTTKEKIITTALDFISKEGLSNLTIRRIAQASGVNVASLNYHFGSKEKLLLEVSRYFKSQITQIFDKLENTAVPAPERLRNFVDDFVSYLTRTPGIPKVFISISLIEKELNPEILDMISYAKNKLLVLIDEITGIENEKYKTMQAMRMISSIIYPFLMGDYLKHLFAFSFENPEDREKYLNLVVSGIME